MQSATATEITPANTLTVEQTVAALKDSKRGVKLWIRTSPRSASAYKAIEQIAIKPGAVWALFPVANVYSTELGGAVVDFHSGAGRYYQPGTFLLPVTE